MILLFLCGLPVGVPVAVAQSQDSSDQASPYAFDPVAEKRKVRIGLVSSYHRGDAWENLAAEGLTATLLKLGYLDDQAQIEQLLRDDRVESGRAQIRKWWMDSKRRKSTLEIAETLDAMLPQIESFAPDILVLGDDNATNYIGNLFLDTALPIVFWGVNGTPVKYDLLDSAERPGHNVTGVYQSVYQVYAMEKLKVIAPHLKTAAVISDDTPTGRASTKVLRMAMSQGTLPLQIKEHVITNDYDTMKQAVLRLQSVVDVLLVSPVATFRNPAGELISRQETTKWITSHSNLPEVGVNRSYVRYGLFCAVDDSAYAQASLAIKMMDDILAGRSRPESMPAVTPPPGGFFVNSARARQLGLLDAAQRSGMVDGFVE